MKKALLLLFFIFSKAALTQSWQQLADFPGWSRDDGCSFTIGNNVYCGSGTVGGVGPMTDFYRFDPTNDTWPTYTVASLPVIGRQYCSAFSYNQYGFVAGGIDANWKVSNLLLKYDTLSNSWVQKASIPDSVYGSVCFFINNKAYLCGGRNTQNKVTNKVWQYDPTNDTWTQKNNMPLGGRWRASGAVIFNLGYLVFGTDSSEKLSNKVFEFNPVLDSWALVDSFPGAGRNYASAFNANNKLIIALGIDSANTVYNDCYSYDVSTHQWATKAPLPSFGRKGCTAFSFNNNIYVTTGIDASNNRLTETWKAGNLYSVEENNKEVEVILYPNPVANKLTVTSIEEISDVKIRDVIGKKIISVKTAGETIILDVNNLSEGVYFLSIKTVSGICIKKIFVQR